MNEFKENTGDEFNESKYEELVGKYIEYKEKEKLNKELKDIVVSEIDALMHIDQIDYKKVFITALEGNFECKYVDRNTTKTDYARLSEVVSDQIYNEVVSTSTSTYLKIGAEAKKKDKKERPIPKAPNVKPGSLPKAKIVGVGLQDNSKKNPFQR
jgi:hypothetical protein